MQTAIRYGVIVGILYILVVIFSYIMGVEFSLNYSFYIMTATSITSTIFVCIRIKKENQGVIKYLEAVKLVFTSIIISVFIWSFFSNIFNTFIVPEYNEQIVNASLDRFEEMFEKMNLAEDKLDEAMQDARKIAKEGLENPLMPAIQTFILIGVVGFVVSLLTSIFVQRNPKEDDFLYEDLEDDNFEKKSGN